MNTDVSDLRALSRDLGRLPVAATGVMYGVIKEGANDAAEMWKRNAKLEADKAAHRFPETIVVRPVVGTGIRFEVYPDERVNGQAKLGSILENGSVTSPPHLWAMRATEEVAPRVERKIDLAFGRLFGESHL